MFLETITCLSQILHDNRENILMTSQDNPVLDHQGEKISKPLFPEYPFFPRFAQYLPSNGMERAYLWKL